MFFGLGRLVVSSEMGAGFFAGVQSGSSLRSASAVRKLAGFWLCVPKWGLGSLRESKAEARCAPLPHSESLSGSGFDIRGEMVWVGFFGWGEVCWGEDDVWWIFRFSDFA